MNPALSSPSWTIVAQPKINLVRHVQYRQCSCDSGSDTGSHSGLKLSHVAAYFGIAELCLVLYSVEPCLRNTYVCNSALNCTFIGSFKNGDWLSLVSCDWSAEIYRLSSTSCHPPPVTDPYPVAIHFWTQYISRWDPSRFIYLRPPYISCNEPSGCDLPRISRVFLPGVLLCSHGPHVVTAPVALYALWRSYLVTSIISGFHWLFIAVPYSIRGHNVQHKNILTHRFIHMAWDL